MMPISDSGIPDWLKWILVTFGALIIGRLSKGVEWISNFFRFKKKEKIEEKTLEQDLDSKRLEDDLKRNRFTMDLLVTAEAQLQKAYETIDEQQKESAKKSKLIQDLRDEMEAMRLAFNNRMIGLERAVRDGVNALNEERNHCNSIRKQLDDIKKLIPEDIKKKNGIS